MVMPNPCKLCGIFTESELCDDCWEANHPSEATIQKEKEWADKNWEAEQEEKIRIREDSRVDPDHDV